MAELHVPGGATHDESDNPLVQHEESDVNIRAILGFGGILIVVAIVIHVAVWMLFGFFESREARRVAPQYPLAAGGGARVPPEPRLQTNPREDLRDLRANEDAILSGYGWVDRSAGIVRIPIDDAMKLTVQRGLPVREGQKSR